MQDTILSSYLDGFSEDFGYVKNKISEQFELFSTYCVVCSNYVDSFEVENAIVGDGGDTGIDAIVVMVNGRICYDAEELKEFIDLNSKIDVRFIFIQSKTSASFDSSDFLNFSNGVHDFFLEKNTMQINDDVKLFRDMKDIVYKNARKFVGQNPSCSMFYVTTGKTNTDDLNMKSVFSKSKNSISSLGCLDEVEVDYIGSDRLYKMYKAITSSSVKEIEMEHYITLPEAEDVEEAVLGRLSCLEFLKLICDESGKIDHNIFSDNIRDYLGNSSVNQEISTTILNDQARQYFILLNNGVTAVAKKIQRVKNNLIIDNIQIVNGCQTSNTLYNNRNILTGDMHIPIKIISTNSQEVINAIIRSTNRQNIVQPEAFESLKEFHRKFEDFCRAKNKDVNSNVYYERRSRQYISDDTIRPVEIISLSNLLAASVSMFRREPHSTHRYYAELLKANKSHIFIDDHLFEPYYLAAYCCQKLTFELRKNPESKKHLIAKYHILMYLWIVMTHGEKCQLNNKKLARDINERILSIVDDRKVFLNICVKGAALFYEVTKESTVDKQNHARSRVITEEMISRISKKDYV